MRINALYRSLNGDVQEFNDSLNDIRGHRDDRINFDLLIYEINIDLLKPN